MKHDLDFIIESYNNNRSIIFDLDDTIFPEVTFLNYRYRFMCQKIFDVRWENPYEFICNEFAQNGRLFLFDKLIKEYKMDMSVNDVIEIFRNSDRDSEMKLYPYQWFTNLAKKLNKKFPLLVITNGNPFQQKCKLKALGLEKFFLKTIYIFANEYGGKPNPEPYYALSNKHELHSPIYIGDSQVDYEFSAKCKAEFIDVKNLL